MANLEVEGIRKRFASGEVLQGVTFAIPSGEIVSVIGPSGSGKTTLFRCILGELDPDAGAVRVDGQDVVGSPIESRGVAIVHQNYALFPHMTVEENVAFGLRARGQSRAESLDRVRAMLDLVQLQDKADRHPRGLSGGERQRVALARALAIEPRILLLDEAFAALDATTRSEVVQQVRGIIRSLGLTTLLITHDQEEAFLFARRVLVLNEGRVVVEGPSEEVMAHPDPFIQSFVKMVHFSRSTVEQDARGHTYVQVQGGARLPITLPNVNPGDEVHVMVKRSPQSETIEVWHGDGRR
jgi:putative spermidine/putrescine transport system ATP-binding protein